MHQLSVNTLDLQPWESTDPLLARSEAKLVQWLALYRRTEEKRTFLIKVILC